MKTSLPTSVKTIQEAKVLLKALKENGESFHPEDDATDLHGDPFTKSEGKKLNKLMGDIYNLKGDFCPCGYLLFLDADYMAEVKENDPEMYAEYMMYDTEQEVLISEIKLSDFVKFKMDIRDNINKNIGSVISKNFHSSILTPIPKGAKSLSQDLIDMKISFTLINELQKPVKELLDKHNAKYTIS